MISLTLPNAGRFWLFSRMFYGIKPRWKIQVPMEYGDIIKFLRGHFFFDERYPISLDSVYIYIYTYIYIYIIIYIHWYCLYIWLYVHPIQFIGHPYQLVVDWWLVCNPGTSRVANEIYH